MTQVKTRVLTAHVPLPLAERVDRLAARLDRSRGWIIKQALTAWVGLEEQRARAPLEPVDTGLARERLPALARADGAGAGADHAPPRIN